jgi:hypothetical protein
VKALVVILISFAATSFSTSTFGAPKVGDSAKFSGTVIDPASGKPIPFTKSVQIVAYDPASDKYRQVETTISAGHKDYAADWLSSYLFLSDADLENELKNCSDYGGVIEMISVKAGQFESCCYTFSSDPREVLCHGQVPFGLVMRAHEGHYQMELDSFTPGR